MKIIVGLGNPGQRYAGTRHNVGFAVVDRLADHLQVSINKNQDKALVTKAWYAGGALLLVKPQTYMNLSGEAVAALAKYYKVSLEDILIIYDDMDLPVGKIRLRYKGGPGSHNGMKSIISLLGSEDFPRLRIGIDRPPEGDWAGYVLEPFRPQELPELREALQAGVEAVLTYVKAGIDVAMNEFNKK